MAETAADIVYRALRSANADPDLAHAVSEAMRDMVGQNVVTEIRADMAELRDELAELRSELKAVHHAIASANRIKTDPPMPRAPRAANESASKAAAIFSSLRELEGVDNELLKRPELAHLPSILEGGELPECVAKDIRSIVVATDRRVIEIVKSIWSDSIKQVESYPYADISSIKAGTGISEDPIAIEIFDKKCRVEADKETRFAFAEFVADKIQPDGPNAAIEAKKGAGPVGPQNQDQDPDDDEYPKAETDALNREMEKAKQEKEKAKPKNDAIFTLPKADHDWKFRWVLYPLLLIVGVLSFLISEEFGEPEEVAQIEEAAERDDRIPSVSIAQREAVSEPSLESLIEAAKPPRVGQQTCQSVILRGDLSNELQEVFCDPGVYKEVIGDLWQAQLDITVGYGFQQPCTQPDGLALLEVVGRAWISYVAANSSTLPQFGVYVDVYLDQGTQLASVQMVDGVLNVVCS